MESISKLNISSICYITENIESVRQLMLNVIAEEDREIQLQEYRSTSSFGDTITILNLDLENSSLERALKHISLKLSASDKRFLNRHFPKRIDYEDKNFYFRLDKFKLLNEDFLLAEGSDVVKISIGYSTFTNSQNSEENVRSLFLNAGIIAE